MTVFFTGPRIQCSKKCERRYVNVFTVHHAFERQKQNIDVLWNTARIPLSHLHSLVPLLPLLPLSPPLPLLPLLPLIT